MTDLFWIISTDKNASGLITWEFEIKCQTWKFGKIKEAKINIKTDDGLQNILQTLFLKGYNMIQPVKIIWIVFIMPSTPSSNIFSQGGEQRQN